jgi:hypothetical protein
MPQSAAARAFKPMTADKYIPVTPLFAAEWIVLAGV